MKKLLLMLVACWAALSAHAVDYYLIGGFNGWALKQDGCKFTDQGNGTFVLDYNGTLTSGFKINDGTWSNDAANFGGSATLQVGVTYNLTVAGTSGNIPLSENIVNPHLVFNPTAKTLLITGQETAAEYIYGIHSNWYGETWLTTNMTEEDGKWILTQREIPAGSFGIKQMDKSTGSQTAWISASGSAVIVPNEAMPCKVEGTNFTNAAGNFKIIFDPEAMTITFEGTQTGEDVKPDYSSWYVNVLGPFNGWEDNGVHPVDGISTTEGLNINENGFKIKVYDGSNDIYYNTGNETPIQINTWVQLQKDEFDGPRVYIEGATSDSEYTVKFNCETNQVYVSGDIEYPEQMYLIGTLPNSVWDPSNPVVLEADPDNEGQYNAQDVAVLNSDDNTLGYFALTTVKTSSQNDWTDVNDNRFGPETDETKANEGNNNAVKIQNTAWSIEPGVYNFGYDFATGILNVEAVDFEDLYLVGEALEVTNKELQGVGNPSYLFTEKEEGVYVLQVASIKVDESFQLKTENGYVYGVANTANESIKNGVAVPVEFYGGEMALDATLLNVTITFNYKEKTLTIDGTPLPESGVVLTPGNDKTEQSGSVDNSDLKITLTTVHDTGAAVFAYSPNDEQVYYKVTPSATKSISTYAADGYRDASKYTNGDYILELPVGTGTISVYSDSNAATPVTYSYSVVFDKNGVTGVEGIEAEAEGEAVYYNLQGVRVENPQKGIFIKVVEGKSSKVVL